MMSQYLHSLYMKTSSYSNVYTSLLEYIENTAYFFLAVIMNFNATCLKIENLYYILEIQVALKVSLKGVFFIPGIPLGFQDKTWKLGS